MEYKPSKDFSYRLAAARRWRSEMEPDLKEVLRFTAPDRARDFDRTPNQRSKQEVDTHISIGEEMATDLAGDLVNYYMPSEQKWTDMEVMVPVPQHAADRVEAVVDQRNEDIYDALDMSNLNDLKPQIMFEAASHGTPGVWMEPGHLSEPLFIEVVPPHEMLILQGHRGYLDRFREKWVPAEFLEATLPDADLDKPQITRKMDKKNQFAKVCWGYWLSWEDPGNPRWLREITVDGCRVTDEREDIGPINGACPMMVGRFNPRPNNPWGRGPGLKALPELWTLDKIEEVVLGKLDEQLDPAWTGVDDGVLDFSNGIIGGHFYPRRSDVAPEPLIPPNTLDYGFYTKEAMEERIRVAFYQDGPRQRGDTPPTASQWLDERRRVQARLGKPSAPLFTELLLPMIQRAEFIMVQLGLLPGALTIDGLTLNVKPISPLQRSHDQEKALITRSNLDLMFNTAGPEAVAQNVDMIATFKNVMKATGDELLVMREEEDPDANETPPA